MRFKASASSEHALGEQCAGTTDDESPSRPLAPKRIAKRVGFGKVETECRARARVLCSTSTSILVP
eukprot:6180847-Pleurochrysis_carterae.AAC.1